jgi:hypothetical protein
MVLYPHVVHIVSTTSGLESGESKPNLEKLVSGQIRCNKHFSLFNQVIYK